MAWLSIQLVMVGQIGGALPAGKVYFYVTEFSGCVLTGT